MAGRPAAPMNSANAAVHALSILLSITVSWPEPVPTSPWMRAWGLSYTQISLIGFASFARAQYCSSFLQTWCVCQA